MSGVSVRLAKAADLPGILEIYNEAVLNTTATFDCQPRTMEYRAEWFDAQQRDRCPVFVATNGGRRVVGWSAFSLYRDRVGFRFTAEDSVYVSADQRGRGIGKLLIPPLIEGARARGLHALLAAIDAENDACIRLHAAFGFEPVGVFKEVGVKFGRWLDVTYMERLL